MADFDLEYGKELTDDDVARYFDACYDESKEYFDPIWRDNARLYAMYYGDTLSKNDKEYLRKTKRPPIDFNYAIGTINAIVGADAADRKEVTFSEAGRNAQKMVISDWLTDINRKLMNLCKGHRHESDAYLDQLIGGYGFAYTYIDQNRYPLRTATERVQPWECYPDPNATEDNLSDGGYFIRRRSWTLEQVQSRWKDKADILKKRAQSGAVGSTAPSPVSTLSRSRARGKDTRNQQRRVEVFDFVYRRLVPKVVWVDPETGEKRNTKAAELAERQKELEADWQAQMEAYTRQADPQTGMVLDQQGQPVQPPQPMKVEQQYTYDGECWYRAYLLDGGVTKTQGGQKNASLVLESRELDVTESPYKVVTGFKYKDMVEGRVRFFGPMRVIHDAQLYTNRSLQVFLDILARGSKGGGFVEQSAVVGNIKSFMEEQSIPGIWQVVQDGALGEGKIQNKPVQQIPQGYERFLELCVAAMSQLTGVTDWVKGTAMQERSNVLISNLQAQSMVMLNPLTDPMTEFRMENGRARVDFSLKYLPSDVIDDILDLDLEGMEDEEKRTLVGVLFEQVQDPQTGELVYQPMLDPETNEPIRPSTVLKRIDVHDYDVAVDVGQASPTSRMAIWQIFQQGLLKALTDAGVDMSIVAPVLMRNLPLPGTQAKALGDEMSDQVKQQKAMQTAQGIVQATLQQGPDGAAQIVQQIVAALHQQGAGQQTGQQSN